MSAASGLLGNELQPDSPCYATVSINVARADVQAGEFVVVSLPGGQAS